MFLALNSMCAWFNLLCAWFNLLCHPPYVGLVHIFYAYLTYSSSPSLAPCQGKTIQLLKIDMQRGSLLAYETSLLQHSWPCRKGSALFYGQWRPVLLVFAQHSLVSTPQ